MKPYSIRGAKREEHRALTRLIVRATQHSGFDDAFIDRARPALAVSLNGIVTGNVQVAEQSGEVIGVVEVYTALQGIAVLGLFVDPAHWAGAESSKVGVRADLALASIGKNG